MGPSIPTIREAERTPLVEALLAIVAAQAEQLQAKQTLEQEIQELKEKEQQLEDQIERLEAENRRLRKQLQKYGPEAWPKDKRSKAADKGPSTSYSLDAENKRRSRRRHHKKSSGRQATEVKVAIADRTQDVYPDGVRQADCQLVRERAVWRLEDGKAVLVAYRIFAGPGGKEGRIPGVTPRCEYGIEILVVLAFLVYIIGISLDKACRVLEFFCGLPLGKSEADALLRQLAKHWDAEFDTLCELLAQAAVVYMDETGWKVGNQNRSLWSFASELQRIFLFGCRKDGATLDKMLPPDVFQGSGVSDDAAVYRNRFEQAQKCWAHLLCKAIRLALLYPQHKKYQRFLDGLLALYHDAKRAAADLRLGDAGRQQRVAEFEGRLCELLQPYINETTSGLKPPEKDFIKLVKELDRLMLSEELFTFVLNPEVEPTNNRSERLLRNAALDRKAGRTNQTDVGAHRRSVIVSVLESLRANLEHFTFASVLEEVTRWMHEGISLFAEQWQKLTAAQPAPTPNTS
jgi:transposase